VLFFQLDLWERIYSQKASTSSSTEDSEALISLWVLSTLVLSSLIAATKEDLSVVFNFSPISLPVTL
jgi:hypothetical protein